MDKRIYADNSATTRVRPEVADAMLKILTEDFGNPSSIHSYGRKAKEYLENSRSEIAKVLRAHDKEIFFTSGGTESDNTVILGLAKYFEENNIPGKEKHIVTSKIEHPAVKEPLEYLEKKGWNVSWISVNKEGFIDLEELKSKVTPKTFLISIIHANNEIGTIQDLEEISRICKKNNVFFHTDAVQSFGKVPLNVKKINADFVSISSHKIYGPKGVGALYVKNPSVISPLLIGGGQQNNLRPGTENLPSIVGFATAARIINNEMLENAKRLRLLQITLVERLSKVNNVILTGVTIDKVKENLAEEKFLYRIPGHVSICVKGVEGETLVLQLDLKGIAASSGSACKSKGKTNKESEFIPSHVLVALEVPGEYIKGSLRMTLGRGNTSEDVDYIVETVGEIVNKLTVDVVIAK